MKYLNNFKYILLSFAVKSSFYAYVNCKASVVKGMNVVWALNLFYSTPLPVSSIGARKITEGMQPDK